MVRCGYFDWRLEGVLTALVAWSIFRERFDWRLLRGIAAIIAGSVVLSSAKYSEFKVSWGSLAVIGASFKLGNRQQFNSPDIR